MAYLKKLQTNNVGPSASTGKLAPKVDRANSSSPTGTSR